MNVYYIHERDGFDERQTMEITQYSDKEAVICIKPVDSGAADMAESAYVIYSEKELRKLKEVVDKLVKEWDNE